MLFPWPSTALLYEFAVHCASPYSSLSSLLRFWTTGGCCHAASAMGQVSDLKRQSLPASWRSLRRQCCLQGILERSSQRKSMI
jgi:hypothetical protein